MTIEKLAKGKELEGMSENEIRKWANEYKNNISVKKNEHGATTADILSGDMFGFKASIRKAAYEWVQEHDNQKPVTAPVVNNQAALSDEDKEKLVNEMVEKMDAITASIDNYQGNDTEKALKDTIIKCDETIDFINSINKDALKPEDLDKLQYASGFVTDTKNFANSVLNMAKYQKKPQQTPAIVTQTQQVNPGPQQQGAAANVVTGFNVSNFVTPAQQAPIMTVPQQIGTTTVPVKSSLPHEICGLSDEQITEEVNKHFRMIPGTQCPLYSLYDLYNNKLLQKKMKEYNCKQRPNNPFLTQVNINDYIVEPTLLAQYQLCFTLPCNDKKSLIVVLFNPIAQPNKNGAMQYPLHIIKAVKNC